MLPPIFRGLGSRPPEDEGSVSSNSTRPDGITMINDAVYKFCDPTGPHEVEIVFVHGLQYSHYKEAYWKTWMGGEKGDEICWPMKWLSEDLPGARIWSLSYDSCALETSTTGRTDTYILGESLVQSMVGLANIGQDGRPIVFVCHCLGGLVVKKIVIETHVKFGKDPKYVNFLRNVRGFFFYATPHEGSKLADLVKHLPFRRWSKLADELQVINDGLGRLNAEFRRIEREHFPKMWTFAVVAETHETKLYGFSAKVVEEASARHGYNKFLSVAADHFGVCTPETRVSSSFQFMRRFVEDVVEEYSDRLLEVPSLMVGMEERLEEVRRKLERHSSIGLVGMGGIGKTTLSKHFYNQERKDFEKSCFLEDVKSLGVKKSQKQLYRDFCGNLSEREDDSKIHLEQIKQCILEKKVLLVVDDVGTEENLRALLVDAFGRGKKGSKVIVTTRRQDILIGGMDDEAILDLDCLNDDKAMDLFSHYAFDHLGNTEKLELDGLAKDISKACGGLPLSIEVMGQFLSKYGHASYADDRRELWERALDKLQKAKSLDGSDNDRLWARLRISYDDLDEDHQSMFLDFACILGKWLPRRYIDIYQSGEVPTLKGLREYLGRIWDDPIGVHNLMRRSLVKWSAERKMLVMHDQLRDFGQSEAKTTRIGNFSEGLAFTSKGRDFNTLEGLSLQLERSETVEELKLFERLRKTVEEVERFERLRLLNLDCNSNLQVVEYHVSLCSEELSWICLTRTGITSTSIQNLGDSCHKLLVLEMSDCQKLEELPESIANLRELLELDLSHCRKLRSLPGAIGELKALKILNVKRCTVLKEIPAGVARLPKLERMDASWCDSLETLCEFGTRMDCLTELNLAICTKLKTIKSLGNLYNLRSLSLKGCGELRIDDLGGHLEQLSRLKSLDLWGCEGLREEIAKAIQRGQLRSCDLETLKLPIIPEGGLPACPRLRTLFMENGLHVTEFDVSPGNLPHLEELWLSDDKVDPDPCYSLEFLRELETLPDFGKLSGLSELDLSDCKALERLPESLGNLSQLKDLRLSSCEALAFLPESLGKLSGLSELDLSDCKALERLPESLGNLCQLKGLRLSSCEALAFLPESLGKLSGLSELDLSDCEALERLPESLGNLCQLKDLRLSSCEALAFLPESLGKLSGLSRLCLSGCKALERLPESLGNLSQLKYMDLRSCEALAFLPESLGKLSGLSRLCLSGRTALDRLPQSLGSLSGLEQLSVDHVQWREVNLSNLQHLKSRGCDIYVQYDDVGE